MSTTIITQFNGQNKASEQGFSSQDDVCIEVCNPITHGEGKDKYVDYEVKVKVGYFFDRLFWKSKKSKVVH